MVDDDRDEEQMTADPDDSNTTSDAADTRMSTTEMSLLHQRCAERDVAT